MSNFNSAVIEQVKSLKGTQFFSMSYISKPALNKGEKMQIGGEVEKITKGTFSINYSYENAVNNRATKETGETSDFVAQPLRWGSWVAGQENKLIEHKGETYLRFYGVKNAKVESIFFVNGEPASAEQTEMIKFFLAAKEKPSATQTNAGLTENQVICRDIKISNIMEITINGESLTRNADVAVG